MGFVGSINVTDDIIWELHDKVAAVDRLAAWLVAAAGGDPDKIRRGPGDSPEAPQAA